jgi:hypothetical protein
MKHTINTLEKVVEGMSCTTIMTLEEIRVFLLVNISSGFILTFVRIPTYRTTEIPEIRSYFLESFKPRCT